MRAGAGQGLGELRLAGLMAAVLLLSACSSGKVSPQFQGEAEASAACSVFARVTVERSKGQIQLPEALTKMQSASRSARDASRNDPKWQPLADAFSGFTAAMEAQSGDDLNRGYAAVQQQCNPLFDQMTQSP
jgi:hypothetical protein